MLRAIELHLFLLIIFSEIYYTNYIHRGGVGSKTRLIHRNMAIAFRDDADRAGARIVVHDVDQYGAFGEMNGPGDNIAALTLQSGHVTYGLRGERTSGFVIDGTGIQYDERAFVQGAWDAGTTSVRIARGRAGR